MDDQNIREAGLKVTTPRLKILEIFEQGGRRHMSAEDVYKTLLARSEEVSLATIYRVLTQFEHAGLMQKHNFEGGQAVFELNEGHHHDHIVCLDCGKVVEFVEASIERAQKKVASEKGFELIDHALILYGNCARKTCPNRKC